MSFKDSLTRIYSLVAKEFIHLKRDWWMPVFILLGGTLELWLIGWSTSQPITNIPIVIMDQDKSSTSRALIVNIENTTLFKTPQMASNMIDVQNELDVGKMAVAIIIPQGYQKQMDASDGKPTVLALISGTRSFAASATIHALNGLAGEINNRIMIERVGVGKNLAKKYTPSVRIWFNEKLNEALYTVPAELGLMLEFTVLIFASIAFARERELGTLEQLLVMPFSTLEIIIGKSIPVILVSLVDFYLMLAMVHTKFDVPIRGSLVLLSILGLVYILVELSKGFMISVLSRTQHQAFLLVMLVGMTDFMFTGYIAPVESMPAVLKLFGKLVPAQHWLTIMRSIMLKGVGVEGLWTQIIMLVILGGVLAGISMRLIRRALD